MLEMFVHGQYIHTVYCPDEFTCNVTINMTTSLDSVQNLEFSQTQYRSWGSSVGTVMGYRQDS